MRKRSSSSVRVFYPKFSLEEVVERIKGVTSRFKEELGLEKVVLFGSYARRSYTVASDIDIFIVYDERKCHEDRVYKTLMKSLKLPRVELHILSKKDYELMRKSKWIEVIESEGRKIIDTSSDD